MYKVAELNLLEYLAAKAGCMYVSDLHLPENQYLLAHIIRRMDIDRYSLGQWNDAVQYITEEKTWFASKDAAAEYLSGYSF